MIFDHPAEYERLTAVPGARGGPAHISASSGRPVPDKRSSPAGVGHRRRAAPRMSCPRGVFDLPSAGPARGRGRTREARLRELDARLGIDELLDRLRADLHGSAAAAPSSSEWRPTALRARRARRRPAMSRPAGRGSGRRSRWRSAVAARSRRRMTSRTAVGRAREHQEVRLREVVLVVPVAPDEVGVAGESGPAVIASAALPGPSCATLAGPCQVGPPPFEWLAMTTTGGGSDDAEPDVPLK